MVKNNQVRISEKNWNYVESIMKKRGFKTIGKTVNYLLEQEQKVNKKSKIRMLM